MIPNKPYLRIEDEDSKRLQTKFGDKRIFFVFNMTSKSYEAWYRPNESAPYKICSCSNVQHAEKQLKARIEYEKYRAADLLKKIDEHNDKLSAGKNADAVLEMKSGLKDIISDKRHFMTGRI